MGHFHSREARAASRRLHTQHFWERGFPVRLRGAEACVHQGSSAANSNDLNSGRSAHAQPANNAERSTAPPHPSAEFEGNIGPPERQRKYGSGKAAADQATTGVHQPGHTSDHQQTTDQAESRSEKLQHPPSISHDETPESTKDCMVCTETRALSGFPERRPTAHCQHDIDVCSNCLRTWIESEFKSKMWNDINCPTCAARLKFQDIDAFAPLHVIRRYQQFHIKALYDSVPDWRWCNGNGCGSGQTHDHTQARFQCKKCKREHCTLHNVNWHSNETCLEYEYRTNTSIKQEEEAASHSLLAHTTKNCPGCTRRVEKSYGCDHMACSMCGTEFCWACLAVYVSKPSAHESTSHALDCVHYMPPRIATASPYPLADENPNPRPLGRVFDEPFRLRVDVPRRLGGARAVYGTM